MVRTQVSFDAEMYEEARRQARLARISLAEFCRRAVARALVAGSRKERSWLRFSGILASGDPDSSRSVDQVVYGRPEP